MARRGDSVIGLDLGKRVFKGVALKRRGDGRFVLTNFASREIAADMNDGDQLAQELKPLIKELGGSGGKGCAVAVSDPAALLRIVEQPTTPTHLLRNALRLNGLAVLNQECREFVVDLTPVMAKSGNDSAPNESGDGGPVAVQSSVATKTKYLVGGILREQVKQIVQAFGKSKMSVDILQLAPVCSFNAFETAYPEIFATDAFLLLDMGHAQSTVLIGNKGELVLVRAIDYGGKDLAQALTADGALEQHAAWTMITEGDAGMAEICRGSVVRLAKEVRNSIGFFEGQCEESINRIFVSGGLARAEAVLQTLSDELTLPCEIWDPLETCEVSLPASKRSALPHEFVSLNVACGAAFEYLNH
jgi:Tfp pilus assembly PilM family ATPase